MTATTESRPKSTSKKSDKKSKAQVGRLQGSSFVAELEQHAPWETWAEKLANRKRPVTLKKLVGRSCRPLEWSIKVNTESETVDLLRLLDSLKRRPQKGEPADWPAVVSDWVETAKQRAPSQAFALESIAWAHALSRLAVRLPAEHWWDLFAFLLNTAHESNAAGVDREDPEHAICSQLFSGELALTLAYWLPRVDACAELGAMARKSIKDGIFLFLDGEGVPQANYLQIWRALLACWTRCSLLDEYVPGRMKKEARLQFEWFVRQALRSRRDDGRFLFEESSVSPKSRDDLVKAALRAGGDQADHDVFSCSNGDLSPGKSEYELPPSSEHSEWAEFAILRSHWTPKSPYIGVAFDHSRLKSEFGIGRDVIWCGETIPDIRIDSKPLQIESEWEELCWLSDKDVDYLELEVQLSGTWKLQRQILLAREDGFAMFADVLAGGTRPSKIDYFRPLPLSEELELSPEEETSEVFIRGKRGLGCMMPLALNEWRQDRSHGEFDGAGLRQRLVGTGLYAPLFIDLDPKRLRKPRTWRQLTIGEQLHLVRRDEAAGFRVQIGKQHWVIYRSLNGTANRTFLGQNVINEFLVARFLNDGEIETLIEIE